MRIDKGDGFLGKKRLRKIQLGWSIKGERVQKKVSCMRLIHYPQSSREPSIKNKSLGASRCYSGYVVGFPHSWPGFKAPTGGMGAERPRFLEEKKLLYGHGEGVISDFPSHYLSFSWASTHTLWQNLFFKKNEEGFTLQPGEQWSSDGHACGLNSGEILSGSVFAIGIGIGPLPNTSPPNRYTAG